MKESKTLKRIKIYLFILIILAIGVMNGCNLNKDKSTRTEKPFLLQTENDVCAYLEEKYPDERFEIISWEYANDYTNARVWNIYSLDTEIMFRLRDHVSSGWKFETYDDGPRYSIKDSYNVKKIEKEYKDKLLSETELEGEEL